MKHSIVQVYCVYPPRYAVAVKSNLIALKNVLF